MECWAQCFVSKAQSVECLRFHGRWFVGLCLEGNAMGVAQVLVYSSVCQDSQLLNEPNGTWPPKKSGGCFEAILEAQVFLRE